MHLPTRRGERRSRALATGLRPSARRAAALLVTLVAASTVAVVPSLAQVVPTTLTLTGPGTIVLGASRAYGGRLELAGTGVPAQDVALHVDGAPAASATTDTGGAYSALLTFDEYGVHQVQAVAHAGTPMEVRSAVLPVEAVPGFDATAPTDLYDATRFIYTGPDAVQQGVADGAIEPARAAVLRGTVRDAAGAELDGVRATVPGHAELGHSTTRDGTLDMVVNGGEPVTVRYEKPGFLPVERQVDVGWRDYGVVPDVVLTPLDPVVTTVTSDAPEPQVVRGSVVSDADGTRRATVVVPEHTEAVMELPDGSVVELDTLHVRATEYTVGDAGPAAMPGELPPASGYTYAVDFTVDEAMAAGATEVRFDRPLPTYTENFLGFPVGTPVPTGYYDYERHSWIAAPNGRVVEVVGVTGGLAELDVTGDGVADTGAALTELGVTDSERSELAGLYTAGQELWRVPVTHFTPWDHNWPYGLPPGARGPNGRPGEQVPGQCDRSGSVIGCENQTLGEQVPVVGAPFSLVYDSSRLPGYTWSRSLPISLTGADLPPDLVRVELDVTIAGRRISATFAPAPNLSHTFVWDGRDAYGRALEGAQEATVRIGYVYRATYYQPGDFQASFAQAGSTPMSANRARQEITLYQEWRRRIGGVSDAALHGLGGWTVSAHHSYDPDSRTLHLGDGTNRPASSVFGALSRFAGTGAAGPLGEGTHTGDGGPATSAGLSAVHGLASAADGTIYLADTGNGVVRAVSPAGVITRFAGGGTPASGNGDGGPATSAAFVTPVDVAVAPDGSVYVLDAGAAVVRRVAPDGTITTVAGGGTPDDGVGDGGPATEAALSSPSGLATGPGGVLYVADSGNRRVRRIAADGTVTTVAGGGAPADGVGDGLPGPQAALGHPADVAAGPDGVVYVADSGAHRVRRVRIDGIVETFAGTGAYGAGGDGGAATAATIGAPTGVAVDAAAGRVLVVQRLHHRIRAVETSGTIRTTAGTGTPGSAADERPPAQSPLREPRAVAVGSDGKVYVADSGNFQVRRIAEPLPGFSAGDIVVPSSDGTEIYQFDATGRHLRTLDALTGAERLRFTYDGSGRLAAVVDPFGETTTIEWTGDLPTAIVSPSGRRTTLETGADGYLDRVANPANGAVRMTYHPGGLLATFTNPRDLTAQFSYDGFGRLVRDDAPDGGFTTLTRTETATGHRVVATTAEGHETTYEVAVLDGSVTRIVTDPAGARTESRTLADGTVVAVDADATVSRRRLAPDPRWGMQVPIPDLVTVTTPGGRTTTASMGRTVVLADPANPLTLQRQTDTLTTGGKTSTAVYEAATRTLTATTAKGRTHVTTYDEHGNTVRVQQGTLAPGTFGYDDRGRLVTATIGTGAGARVTTMAYDADGLLTRLSDPLHTREYVYDAIGRMVTDKLPGGSEVGYGHDANGNITSLTPPGRPAYTFGYSPGDVLQRSEAPGAVTTYGHDRDRRPLTVTRPGNGTVSYRYDGAGRLDRLSTSRGDVDYTYDATSQVVRIAGPGGEIVSFTRDGELLTEIRATGTGAGRISYSYDGNGRLSGRALNGGTAVATAYDDDGLLTAAGPLSLTWDPANAMLGATAIGRVATAHSYNPYGEPAGVSATYDSNPLYGSAYERDAVGRITRRTETVQGVTTVEDYTYDARGRLTDVVRDGSPVLHLEYDANGNRTARTDASGTIASSYDEQDRLLTAGATSYTYAGNGEVRTRTTGSDVTTYTYDEIGNLLRADLADGRVVEYVVDAEGRRVGKKVDGTLTRRFLYGLGSLPAAELDASGNVVSAFGYASRGHVPDYMTKGGATYRILGDQNGSPRLVVNVATGAVAQRIDYDAFGNVVSDTNPGFQPFGFAGGLYDPDTGLVRFGVRDYDPATGRFTAKDPVGLTGGDTNLYAYAGGDPVNLVDPTGLDWLQNLSDAAAGFGDAVTFGGTRAIRRLIGVDDVVNYCSGWYTGGEIAGEVVSTIATSGGGGAARAGARGVARFGDDVLQYGDDVARALPSALHGGARNVHVYYGTSGGKRVYTGITNNLGRRQSQHGSKYVLEPITTSPLTRGEARAIEEALIVRNPNFTNKIHSISPKHPYYQQAVEWGEAWLRAHGR